MFSQPNACPEGSSLQNFTSGQNRHPILSLMLKVPITIIIIVLILIIIVIIIVISVTRPQLL